MVPALAAHRSPARGRPVRRTRAQRVAEVAAWLAVRFPAPYPVRVEWVARIAPDRAGRKGLTRAEIAAGDYAAIWLESGPRILIQLSRRMVRTVSEAVHALLHEWAHAESTRHWKLEKRRKPGGHDAEWGIAFARIYSAFYDEFGWRESRSK